jgi:hypothetical protein
MNAWLDPHANTPAERWQTFGLAIVATIGALCALALSLRDDRPMSCHEDEALVWTNAPITAECIPIDDLPYIWPFTQAPE